MHKWWQIWKYQYPWYVIFYGVVLYFATVLNYQLLSHVYRILAKGETPFSFFYCTPPLVLICLLTLVFLPFTSKYLFRIVMTILLLTGSLVSFYAVKYGIIFDSSMMNNLLQTNLAEAKSYLNWYSGTVFLLFGVLPTIILWSVRIKWSRTCWRGLAERGLIFSIALLILGGIYLAYYQNYASIGRNNPILRKELSPYNYLYSFYKVVKHTYFDKPIPFLKLAEDAQIDNPEERPELFVVVIGETARAQNFPQNGYERNTTPFTEHIDNLTFFQHVRSCGTATAVSLPCMFSAMSRQDYDEKRAVNSSSIADILMYAGYHVTWFDNDGGCKGVCDRIPHVKDLQNIPKNHAYCNSDSCYDEVLLPLLQQRLAEATHHKQSTIVFLHLMGSHGPTYYQRVPHRDKKFKPACERADIENCSLDEIRNSYDDTLVYSDKILAQVISILTPYAQDFGTGLVYISDHGESLGEYGMFLHGTPYAFAPEFQTRVPMMTWFSSSFIADHQLDLKCLQQRAQQEEFSHDNFYHSILGILDVNTSYYESEMDIFRQCRVWNPTNKK